MKPGSFFIGTVDTLVCCLLQIPCFRECCETAVVGSFCFRRKTAAGQLFALQVILEAFAADSLSAATRIAARTEIHILLFFTFHHIVLSVLYKNPGRKRSDCNSDVFLQR